MRRKNTTGAAEPQDDSQRRIFFLENIAEALRILLTETDIFPAIEHALTVIGQSSAQDRAFLFLVKPGRSGGPLLFRQHCEWVREGITPQIENPQLQSVDLAAYSPKGYEQLRKGLSYQGSAREMNSEERAIMEEQDIQSILLSPVFGGGRFIGFIGFDCCLTVRPWLKEELLLLETTAAAIGAALIRAETMNRLEESDLRFRRMLDEIPQMSVQGFDEVGTIRYWNRASETLYGYTREEALGANLLDLIIPPALRETVRGSIQDALMGTPIPCGELTLQRKDGSPICVYSSHSMVQFPGFPPEFFCLDIDLTELKSMETQWLRSQRMEAIGNLAGGIGHDLNNVLSPLLMSVGMLKLNEVDPQSLDTLGLMETSIRRGADMIRHLLSFARGMEGQQVTVQLRLLLKDLGNIIGETFPKYIHFDFKAAPDLSSVLGDPTQLHQVLLNLCVNARDAMPEGGTLTLNAENVTLKVAPTGTLGATPVPGPHIRLVVSDSGSGIPPETALRIFEPFFSTKARGKGSGLGLSTSLAILKSHGGCISFTSRPGEGTRFVIHLPVVREVQAPVQSPVAEKPNAPPPKQGRGQLILVVDDEAPIRDVTRKTLELHGYRVVTADNGAKAVELFGLSPGKIRLVITDLMMPVMDGVTAMREIRKIMPSVPILATSGMSSGMCTSDNPPKEATRLLQKPYNAAELLREVGELIQG